MLTLSTAQGLDLPRLFLISVPEEETPAQHIRNALQSLSLLKEGTPAFWAFNVELSQAAVHATAAMMVVEHGGPIGMVLEHLRAAIKALLVVDVDWEVIIEVPAACGRLLWALYQLTGDPERN